MSRASEIDLAEDVALITFSMTEALNGWCEALLPGSYRYHVFDGFPGFCDQCGLAGLALAKAFRRFDTDEWIDTVERFADAIIRRAILQEHGVSPIELDRLARAAVQDAILRGVARKKEDVR